MALAEGMFWAKKAPTHPNDLNRPTVDAVPKK